MSAVTMRDCQLSSTSRLNEVLYRNLINLHCAIMHPILLQILLCLTPDNLVLEFEMFPVTMRDCQLSSTSRLNEVLYRNLINLHCAIMHPILLQILLCLTPDNLVLEFEMSAVTMRDCQLSPTPRLTKVLYRNLIKARVKRRTFHVPNLMLMS